MTHHATAPVFGEQGGVPSASPSLLSSAQFHSATPLPHHTAPPQAPAPQVSHPGDVHTAHFGVDNPSHLAPYRVGTRTTTEHATSISASGLYPHSSHTMGSLWDFGRPRGE
jgi:hypothetical protein